MAIDLGNDPGGTPPSPAEKLQIRSAIGVGQTDAPTFLAITLNDTPLVRDAAGILAQRNGTAKQTLRIYNTYTSASIYERAVMDWNGPTPGNLQIGTEFLGSGSGMAARPIDFVTGGVARWQISAAGHLLAATHDANDIGATGGVSCPRNIFAAGTIHATGFSVAFQSNITGTGVALYDGNTGTSIKTNAAAGIILLGNAIASTDFGRLQLGGTTDSFPAIARDGAGTKFTGGAAGSTSWIKVPAVAVASLPAAATAGVGARAFVNNALSPTFGSAVTGGGAVTVPVYSTGAAWNVG